MMLMRRFMKIREIQVPKIQINKKVFKGPQLKKCNNACVGLISKIMIVKKIL